MSITQLVCQNSIENKSFETDSLDSTQALPFDTVDINIKDDDIKSPVHYKALDSIVYDVANKMLYLYGNAEMKYENTQVNSENVTFDWNTQTLSAEGIDSMGKKIKTPILKQDGKTFEAKRMDYNFGTLKGKIYDVVTEDNGAFIHSEIVKKTENNEWLSHKAKYTTCNDKEHPHFYIQSRKAKIIPDKIMVSGPANLVVSGINTPLALPFAIFPIKNGRRSGIIMPQFGVMPIDGSFFLKDGGYYWATNEYLSMGFTGEIVTNGTFGLKIASRYKVRYKSNGNVLLSYRRVVPSDPYKYKNNIKNEYNIIWSHYMDSKADPFNYFAADVNVKSSSFNKNALIQDERILEVINTSHITYRRTFSGKPYNLTISANHSQNNKTHKFNITLPQVAFNVNTITPFKSKIQSKRKKIYERIGFNYGATGKAIANTIDSTFLTDKTLEDIKYGIEQKFSTSATYNILKYFNFTPRFTYEEQWMFKEETLNFKEHYLYVNDTITDTLYTQSVLKDGFFARRKFNANLAISTKLTGIYNFKAGPVKAIQHILTPSLSYNYHPDFSNPIWNYYNSYYDENKQEEISYSRYLNTGIFTPPGYGESNTINFLLGNRFEMKVLNKKDTTSQYKKIPFLDNLTFNTGYNFAGDSINKFQNVNVFARTSFLKNLFALSGTLIYNPYSVDSFNNKIPELYLNTDGKPLRFVSLKMNLELNLRGKPKTKKSLVKNEYSTIEELEYITNNPELYYDFDIPWSFRASYHMQLSNGIRNVARDTMVLGLGSISVNGDITITPKWLIAVRTGYDIKNKDLTLTNFKLVRDLHCWQMSLDWTAYPIKNQYFTFELRVKSALLQDLKLTRKHVRSNYNSTF